MYFLGNSFLFFHHYVKKLESIEKYFNKGCNDFMWIASVKLIFKIHVFEKVVVEGIGGMCQEHHLGLWLSINLQEQQTFNLHLKAKVQSFKQWSQGMI
jgi:hypothetical protein